MDILQGIKNRPTLSLLIMVLVAFVIVWCAFLLMGGSPPQKENNISEIVNGTPEQLPTHEKDTNIGEIKNGLPDQLPEDLRRELEAIQLNITFEIRTWEFDPDNNQVIIHAYDIINENEVNYLQGRQVGNWTIRVVHDVGYEEEKDRVRAELMEMENMRLYRDQGYSISKLELDYESNQAIVYVTNVYNEENVNDLQGRQVGNWTIRVVHDVNYEKELNLLVADLEELRENPELNIASFTVSPKKVNILVWNLTPENQALKGTMMHGRRVYVWKTTMPPTEDRE
jgi:hypothetical protein